MDQPCSEKVLASSKTRPFHVMASIIPGIRRAVPQISRNFFVCRQCMKQSSPILRTVTTGKSSLLRNIRFNSSVAHPPNTATTVSTASPLSSLSQTISNVEIAAGNKKASNPKFFPETSSKSVAYWLLGSAVSVFGIVVFGGLTRLTESGYT